MRQSHANVPPLGGVSTDKGQSVTMKNLPNLVRCRRYSRALVTMSRSILFRSCRDSDPQSLFTDWNCNRACNYYHGITLDMSFSNCFWSRWLIIDFLRIKMNKYFLLQGLISYRWGHKLYSFWNDFWCDMFYQGSSKYIASYSCVTEQMVLSSLHIIIVSVRPFQRGTLCIGCLILKRDMSVVSRLNDVVVRCSPRMLKTGFSSYWLTKIFLTHTFGQHDLLNFIHIMRTCVLLGGMNVTAVSCLNGLAVCCWAGMWKTRVRIPVAAHIFEIHCYKENSVRNAWQKCHSQCPLFTSLITLWLFTELSFVILIQSRGWWMTSQELQKSAMPLTRSPSLTRVCQGDEISQKASDYLFCFISWYVLVFFIAQTMIAAAM